MHAAEDKEEKDEVEVDREKTNIGLNFRCGGRKINLVSVEPPSALFRSSGLPIAMFWPETPQHLRVPETGTASLDDRLSLRRGIVSSCVK